MRYFNLKEGSEKMGGIIKVNTSMQGLEKLSNPQGDRVFTPWAFEYIGIENEEDVYRVFIPHELAVRSSGQDAIGGEIGVAKVVLDGLPSTLKLILNKKGELRFYNPDQKGFYLNEVSEKAAKKHEEFEKYWALQRAYIYE